MQFYNFAAIKEAYDNAQSIFQNYEESSSECEKFKFKGYDANSCIEAEDLFLIGNTKLAVVGVGGMGDDLVVVCGLRTVPDGLYDYKKAEHLGNAAIMEYWTCNDLINAIAEHYEPTTPEYSEEEYWMSNDGPVRYCDMSGVHLINALHRCCNWDNFPRAEYLRKEILDRYASVAVFQKNTVADMLPAIAVKEVANLLREAIAAL